MKLNELGLHIPQILLPKNINSNWPVIACDQFTQDREYWQKAKEQVKDSPSTLNLIFPEAYLQDGDAKERIASIHSNMANYLQNGVFQAPRQGFTYIERDTPCNKSRRGLIAAVDLEKYDWHPQASPLIRSTEGTVEDRLPPRMDIRRGAPLELPHILLLIDDDKDSLLPSLGERAKKAAPVYETNLMMESGKVSGWFIDSENDFSFIEEQLTDLYNRSVTRYSNAQLTMNNEQLTMNNDQLTDAKSESNAPFLFAVGDGNHSLAAAKGIWEEYKKANGVSEHPLRYALVEIQNIHDPAIQFEPIHRVISGASLTGVHMCLSRLKDFKSRQIDMSPIEARKELVRLVKEQPVSGTRFGLITEDDCILVTTSETGVSTASLQPLLDGYVKPPLDMDYIHDEEEVIRITCLEITGSKKTGILLPPIQKAGFFETIARTGPLPCKSFSMGHSSEKRFYLEARRIGTEGLRD